MKKFPIPVYGGFIEFYTDLRKYHKTFHKRTGTLSDQDGDQFDYCEGSPKNWRSGFVVLTFRDSKLMWPEVVYVIDDDHVGFRGEIIEV